MAHFDPLKNWKAPEDTVLPDFIIGGSMKCGTTTLHNILEMHPKIYFPRGEVNFFDMDDLIQHGDFIFQGKDKWFSQDINENPEKMWQWYSDKFKGKENFVKGEDSTVYINSPLAAKRIALQEKPIKLIFLLRHPTKRAYSQYFHMLRTGGSIYSFEDTIRYNAASILDRSLYKRHLETYFKLFPKDRIKIVLFEDLISNTEETIKEVCEFLSLDYKEFGDTKLNVHSNKGKLPVSIEMQYYKNQMFRRYGHLNYITRVPNSPVATDSKLALFYRIFNRAHRFLVPSWERDRPKIKPATQELLDNYFIQELNGLDELTGKNMMEKWFPEKYI